MRFLHTSDWHIGKTFNTRSRYDEQVEFIDWFIAKVEELNVDRVLIAGDIFDRSAPSEESIALLDSALSRLVSLCPVVLISGNHDSPHRIAYGGWAFESAGLHVRSSLEMVGVPVTFEGDEGEQVHVYGIHYLDPDQSHRPLRAPRTHEGVLTAAMDLVRADMEAREGRSIVVAHAFIAGGESSDSERVIAIGGAQNAPLEAFRGIDYLALGHLHRPQSVSSGDDLPLALYSGSPLAYSFSEQHHKSVILVDMPPRGDVTAERIEIPVGRKVVTLTESVEDLLGDRCAEHAESWVRIFYRSDDRLDDAWARFEARFPYLLSCDRDLSAFEGLPRASGLVDVSTDAPMDVLEAFVREVAEDGVKDDDRAVLNEVLEAVQREAGAS